MAKAVTEEFVRPQFFQSLSPLRGQIGRTAKAVTEGFVQLKIFNPSDRFAAKSAVRRKP